MTRSLTIQSSPLPAPGRARALYLIQRRTIPSCFPFCLIFSVLWLLGLLIDPDNPKVRFHVNQGILLSIFSGAYSLVMTVLNAMFTFLPFMYIFTALLSVLGGVAVFALMVWGVVNAAQDKEELLPVFGTLYTFIK